MQIITSGQNWIDIDALACGIAYKELKGENSKVVFPGKVNSTVPESIRLWDYSFETEYTPNENDEFVIVDISDYNYFANFVDLNRVTEIFDHHHGFENYWQEKLKLNKIEMVGACATLIWEEFKKANKNPSETSANLLYAAIVSNTLNLTSLNTTERDINAFNELKDYISLPDNWIEDYYHETEKMIMDNPIDALKHDTKVENGITIAQLEFWDARDFLNIENIEQKVEEVLNNDLWFLTIPCIKEGINYFITSSEKTKQLLTEKIGVEFNNNLGTNKQILLRKEILKILN